jgi:hypothetical protein
MLTDFKLFAFGEYFFNLNHILKFRKYFFPSGTVIHTTSALFQSKREDGKPDNIVHFHNYRQNPPF